jgi:hypothetical protein
MRRPIQLVREWASLTQNPRLSTHTDATKNALLELPQTVHPIRRRSLPAESPRRSRRLETL